MRAKKLSTLIILLFTAAFAHAATRLVPAQYPNIQAAIDDCNHGDTVIVAPGTYTGPGNRDIDFLGKPITVRSTDPNDPKIVAQTIIDCQSSGRAFFLKHCGPAAVSGLTITNGYAYYGGALRCWNANARISKCVLTRNKTDQDGGAIYCADGETVIDKCILSSNEAAMGGGIYCLAGEMTITNCTIGGNTSLSSGGGIYCNGTLGISNCTIRMNSVGFYGGGIFCMGGVVIGHCSITDNRCEGSISDSYEQGGGIYSNNAILEIDDSVISRNVAGYDAGMFCLGGEVIISDCIISSNSSSGYAAGVRLMRASCLMRNCTFSQNDTAGWSGGVMISQYGDLAIANCIFCNNISPKGRNIVMHNSSDVILPTMVSVAYSNVEGGQERVYLQNADCTLFWDNSNIGADPRFVNPSEGDYHLSPGSCCIEGGDPCYAPVGETDIDGDTRIMGRRVDIGADEFVFETPYIEIPAERVLFDAVQGHANPQEQILSIHNPGLGSLNWQIAENCYWLQVYPTSGTAGTEPSEVSLVVDTTDMRWGAYDGDLTISDPNASNSPVVLPVGLEIIGPILSISSSQFDFQVHTEDLIPPDQILSIENTGGGTLYWEITVPDESGWLTVYPLTGRSSGDVNAVALHVDATGLAPGFYTSEVTITDPNAANSPQTVEVSLHFGLEQGRLYVPSEHPNIQAAIDWALPGDVVVVAPGTYTGPGNHDIDFKGKGITVRSIDPNNAEIIDSTIIDCNSIPYYRAFHFHSGEDANSILSGFTITRGYTYGPKSGAIVCENSSPTMSNCTITANACTGTRGYSSAGIHCYESSAIVSNCTITDNKSGCGGGIYCSQSNLVVTNCLFTGNSSGPGGGIYCSQSNVVVTNCLFAGNSCGSGGGIYCWQSSVVIDNCIFSGNSVESSGGAIYSARGNVSLGNATVTENSADARGGALFCDYSGKATITNSILYFNAAPSGPEIALYPYYDDPSLLNLAVSYSNVRGGPSAVWNQRSAPVDWGPGNIDAEPYFVDANNGDYHLKSGGWRWDAQRRTWTWDTVTSRCIDAGDPDAPLRDEPLFIPVDPTGYWGANLRIDMGAYGGTAEASIPPHDWAIRTDYNNDGIGNFTDFAYWTKSHPYTAGEPLGPLNPGPSLDPIDLGVLAADWLDQATWFGTVPPPTAAWNPNPPNGSVGIRLDPALGWEPGFGATSHDVYFGASDPPTFQASTTATTFAPGYLSKNTTYYWRIDEVNPFGKTAGPVWSFTTGTGGGH